jgi:hypothetical protein
VLFFFLGLSFLFFSLFSFYGLSDPLLNFGSGIRFKTEPRDSGSFGNDPPSADRGDVVLGLAALGGHTVALEI